MKPPERSPFGPLARARSAFFALLAMVVCWSVHGLAQASATERERLATAKLAPHADAEPAAWRNIQRELPPAEVSALEAEADGDPVTPELPGIIRPAFGCLGRVTSSGQVPHVATETYTIRFAPSSVLARAPPDGAR